MNSESLSKYAAMLANGGTRIQIPKYSIPKLLEIYCVSYTLRGCMIIVEDGHLTSTSSKIRCKELYLLLFPMEAYVCIRLAR